MFSEVYDAREILLGLRNVYQENRKQLESLKKYAKISGKIGDCGFFLYPYGNGADEYSLYFKYLMASESAGILRADQSYYNFSNVFVDPYHNKVALDNNYVTIKKHEEFINSMNDIFKSDFAKLIVRNNMHSIDYNLATLFTTLNEVNIFTNQSNNTYNSLLSYDSYNDQLDLTLYYDNVVNKDFITKALNDILSIQFHKGQFSNYILENINDVDTNIEIDLYNYRHNPDNSKTYIFGIDCDKKLLKSKKSTF